MDVWDWEKNAWIVVVLICVNAFLLSSVHGERFEPETTAQCHCKWGIPSSKKRKGEKVQTF